MAENTRQRRLVIWLLSKVVNPNLWELCVAVAVSIC
jgi:hypothetical protein